MFNWSLVESATVGGREEKKKKSVRWERRGEFENFMHKKRERDFQRIRVGMKKEKSVKIQAGEEKILS